MTRRDYLILAGAMTVLFLLGISGSIYYPSLSDWFPFAPTRVIFLKADRDCNPVGKFCMASNATLGISLKLGNGIRSLTPFPVQVNLIGEGAATAKKVAIYLTMSNMNMGFNRFDLDQRADKTWRGQAMLPVCSMGRRDWQVAVEIVSDDKRYAAEFYLLTGP